MAQTRKGNRIEFVECRPYSAPSGGLSSELGYKFRVDDLGEVVVRASTFAGRLSHDDVRARAQLYVQMEIDEGRVDLSKSAELVLDSGAIARVEMHPDWPKESCKSI